MTRLLWIAWLALCVCARAAAHGDVPNIAAASDLQFALPQVAALFEAHSGHPVKLIFGSSGNLRAVTSTPRRSLLRPEA